MDQNTAETGAISGYLKKSNKPKMPKFNHPEIESLYEYGLDIPHDVLAEILALPYNTLRADLENILTDAKDRYDYFQLEDFDDGTDCFVLHSFYLLIEINAFESLPKIISFLENDFEFLDFWLGDHLTENGWLIFYTLCINDLSTIRKFILQPEINIYPKGAATEALSQIVLHNSDRKQEALLIFDDIFNNILKSDIDDDLLDPEFIGLMVGDAIDSNMFELKPLIKRLYEKNLVALGVNGNYKEVEKEFANVANENFKREVFNIFELYDNVLASCDCYNEDDEFDYPYQPIQPAVSEKIGRNEPCPCGSGKKYKKCCINE